MWSRHARRQAAQSRAEIPDLIELIIIAVRAGLAPSIAFESAVEHAGPTLRPSLEVAVHRLHRGERLAEALGSLPVSLGPAAVSFANSFASADRYGLPIEPMLDQLASDVRLERSRIAQAEARTLPVRLAFPLVTCTLPSFVLLAIAPALLGALSTLRGTAP